MKSLFYISLLILLSGVVSAQTREASEFSFLISSPQMLKELGICKNCDMQFKRQCASNLFCSKKCRHSFTRKQEWEELSKKIISDGELLHIPINNLFFIIDKKNLPLIKQYFWHLQKSRNTFYVVSQTSGKKVYLHRLLISPTASEFVDHINGNGLDCSLINLRKCTPAENSKNRTCAMRKSSLYKGVRRQNNKWLAAITIDYKTIRLGLFATQREAATVYNEAALKYFGDFARINVV